MTSAEVVRRVKRRVRVKVGHLGTLDPFATGLLPLCLGEATKIAQFLNTADKRYEGVIRLGWATDTGDRTGARVRDAAVPALARRRPARRGARASSASSCRRRRCTRRSSATACRSTGWPAGASRSSGAARRSRSTRSRSSRRDADAAALRARLLEGHLRAGPGRGHRRRARHAPPTSRRCAAPASAASTSRTPSPSRPGTPTAPTGFVSLRQALGPSAGRHRSTRRAAEAARQGKAWVLDAVLAGGRRATRRSLDPAGEVVAVVVRERRPLGLRARPRAPATFTSDHAAVLVDDELNKTEERWELLCSERRSWSNSTGFIRPTRGRPKSRSRC